VGAQAVVATANVGGTSYGVAYDSGKGEIFVTHFFNDTVTVLSDSNNAVVSTLSLGVNYEPVGVAYDSAKGEIFVANYGANTVSVISDATGKAVTNVTVGAYPEGVVYDPAMGQVFVVSGTSRTVGEVTVISDTTNAVVATISVGNFPRSIAFDSAKGEIFVANYGADTVSVISDSNDSVVATLNVGTGPAGIAYDSAKGEVFVTNYGDNTVMAISDTTDKAVATIDGVLGPSGIAYDSAKGELYVANEGNLSVSTTSVSVISDSTNAVTTDVNTGLSNTVLAYDPGKREVFVGGGEDNIVAIISDGAEAVSTSSTTTSTGQASASTSASSSACFSSGSIGAQLSLTCTSFSYETGSGQSGPGTVAVGIYPLDLAYDSGKGEIFVTDFSGPTVSVVADSSNSVVSTIDVPGLNNPGFKESPSPQGIAYDSGKGELFIANLYGDCITVISDATNAVVTTIDLGNDSEDGGLGVSPESVVYDSAKGEIFVANLGLPTIVGSYQATAGTVSVISDATNSVTASIPVGSDPDGIAYDSAKGEIFVLNAGKIPGDVNASNFDNGTVSVISDASNSVVATLPVGPFPQGIAYVPDKGEFYVGFGGKTATSSSPANSGGVSVISDSTDALVATINLADSGEVAYDSAKGELFVVTPDTNSTSVISDATNTVVATVPAGPAPYEIAYDPAKGELFVTNPSADIITILSDSTPATTSSSSTSPATSKSSSLALDPTYVAIILVNAAVLAALVALSSTRGRNRVAGATQF
jgi:YVTN family beta-propeller protein